MSLAVSNNHHTMSGPSSCENTFTTASCSMDGSFESPEDDFEERQQQQQDKQDRDTSKYRKQNSKGSSSSSSRHHRRERRPSSKEDDNNSSSGGAHMQYVVSLMSKRIEGLENAMQQSALYIVELERRLWEEQSHNEKMGVVEDSDEVRAFRTRMKIVVPPSSASTSTPTTTTSSGASSTSSLNSAVPTTKPTHADGGLPQSWTNEKTLYMALKSLTSSMEHASVLNKKKGGDDLDSTCSEDNQEAPQSDGESPEESTHDDNDAYETADKLSSLEVGKTKIVPHRRSPSEDDDDRYSEVFDNACFATLQTTLGELEVEVSQLRKTVVEQQEKVQTLEQQGQSDKFELEVKECMIRELHKKLQEQHEVLQQFQLPSLETELSSTEQELRDERDALRRQHDDLQAEIEQLKQQETVADQVLVELTEELEALKIQCDVQKADIESLEREKVSMQFSLERITNERDSLQRQSLLSEQVMAQVEQERIQVQRTLEKRTMEEMQDERDMWQAKCQSQEKSFQVMEDECRELTRQLNELQDSHTGLKAQCSMQQDRINNLEDDLERAMAKAVKIESKREMLQRVQFASSRLFSSFRPGEETQNDASPAEATEAVVESLMGKVESLEQLLHDADQKLKQQEEMIASMNGNDPPASSTSIGSPFVSLGFRAKGNRAAEK